MEVSYNRIFKGSEVISKLAGKTIKEIVPLISLNGDIYGLCIDFENEDEFTLISKENKRYRNETKLELEYEETI